MFFAFGETVTVRDPAVPDRSGDAVTPPATRAVDGVGIDWQMTSSVTDRRQTAISEVRAFFPAGDPIKSVSEVQLPDGDWYRVVGKPMAWHQPMTGWDPGIVVRLRAVKD